MTACRAGEDIGGARERTERTGPAVDADRQAAFAATLVDEWVRAGVAHAVVCPGSRSTPLALAVAAEPRLGLHVRLDERSAGFSALGIGTATGVPAVVVVTSGTAAAELHAAVSEADLARVPLVVCTADRPPELRDVGAPQTLDQTHLYGRAPRWFADPGVPDAATRASWRSLGPARSPRPSPVHVARGRSTSTCRSANRCSAIPSSGASPTADLTAPPGTGSMRRSPPLRRRSSTNWSRSTGGRRGPVGSSSPGPVAGAGRGPGAGRCAPVAGAGRSSVGPARPGPRGGVRCGRDPPVGGLHRGPPARPGAAARRAVGVQGGDDLPGRAPTVVVDPHGWADPDRSAERIVRADPTAFCRALTVAVAAAAPGRADAASGWSAGWASAEARARKALEEHLVAPQPADRGRPGPTEPALAARVAAAVPAGSVLVVSSSMPVRDVEAFGGPRRDGPRVVADRGANGIDGVVSTALGVALATGPTTVLVGDLAFLHDVSALVGPPATARR